MKRLASVANATDTLLCWQVGCRLLRENLQAGPASYGKQILATLSQALSWSHFVDLLLYPAASRLSTLLRALCCSAYGKQILVTVSRDLTIDHGGDFKPKLGALLEGVSA